VVRELEELIAEGRSRLIGAIRQELLSGIKAQQQFEKLRLHLAAFQDEVSNASDHEAAAKASNDCRAQGIIVSAIDILICAIALDRGWSIFSTDPDFQNYAKVLPVTLHSVRR
jgi:predicted nucleic acid-binding protein